MQALILDGQTDAALEVLQALGRAGVEVDVASERPDCLAFHSRYLRRRLGSEPLLQAGRFTEWLRELDAKAGYDLIVPSSETSLVHMMPLGEDDPLWVKAVLPSTDSLATALDKQRTWEMARRLGVSVPESLLIESHDQLPPVRRFPVVLKPIRSKVLVGRKVTSLRTQVVHTEAQRQDFLRAGLRHGPIQQQEYVPGHGAAVDLLYERGTMVWHFAHERIHEVPLSGGASSYRRSMLPSPELLKSARTMLDALRWHGVAMLEYRIAQDGSFWLMEINPRLWGSLALAVDAGVNFPLGLLALARASPAGPQPTFRAGVYTRHIQNDLRWLRANLGADHGSPWLLTHPRLRSFGELLRPLAGRESWDHFDVKDLGVMAAMLRQTGGELWRGGSRVLRDASLKRRLTERHRQVAERITSGQMPIRSLLFLCFGNICRSPFAMELGRTRLPRLLSDSAGFHRTVGRETPPEFAEVAASLGVDLLPNRSKRTTREMIEAADLVLVMDLENYRDLQREFPEATGKTTLLGLFAADAQAVIPDPYGAPESEIRNTLALIQASIEGLAAAMDAVAEPASLPLKQHADSSTDKSAVPASSIAGAQGTREHGG
jgi:protein-tyrosine-phosphatase/predicted ATP-grasp superfamily ATP-dependent carboligase